MTAEDTGMVTNDKHRSNEFSCSVVLTSMTAAGLILNAFELVTHETAILIAGTSGLGYLFSRNPEHDPFWKRARIILTRGLHGVLWVAVFSYLAPSWLGGIVGFLFALTAIYLVGNATLRQLRRQGWTNLEH